MTEILCGKQQDTPAHAYHVKLTSFENGFRGSGELRSLTSLGATVRLTGDQNIPDRFSILIPNFLVNVGCHVVWKHRNEIGLLFDQRVDGLDVSV